MKLNSDLHIPRPWLTVQETAEYLGVSVPTVRNMIIDHRLTAYRLGTAVVRLHVDDIDTAMGRIRSGGAA